MKAYKLNGAVWFDDNPYTPVAIVMDTKKSCKKILAEHLIEQREYIKQLTTDADKIEAYLNNKS